jgi:catechol 2,3-dioxygenase-like lactoylglutathione lyase family enzyme
MKFQGIHYLSAVLLTSKAPAQLAKFYKEVLNLPLEDEQHGETEKHYGCELGDLHFAIHPAENFGNSESGVGSVKIAFEVFDMEAFVARMKELEIDLLYPPRSMGPMLITAIKDPDGNLIEFTQLGEKWIKHLESRRKKGFDIIQEWKRRHP